MLIYLYYITNPQADLCNKADFYCQKLKLGIEIDGESHLGQQNEKYDSQRTVELERLGIKLLRFWNEDILEGVGEVESIIENNLTPLIPPLQGGQE